MEKKRINFLAIRSIRPTGEFGIDETYSTLTWFDWNTEKKPTEKEFNDAVKAWQTEYDAKQYQRDRNYPNIGEQLDMLWHAIDNGEILGDKSCNFFKTLKKVKDDNPKPE